jgi:hypothetical protein
MATAPPASSVAGADEAQPKTRPARSVILGIAAAWFLIAAFSRLAEDTTVALIGLVQQLAFGFALVAIALIDWRKFRWWWLLVAVLVVGAVWMATGHPLLFLVGGY